MSKHTPGPWHIAELTKAWGVYDSTGTAVARVGGAYGVSFERRKADARLIAAAPELLEALRNALDCLGKLGCNSKFSPDCDVCEAEQFARAAIAKATGETNANSL